MRLILILTKPPSNLLVQNDCVKLASPAMPSNHKVGLYLIGDAVFCAKKGQGIAENLGRLILYGGEVFVCKEDLDALRYPKW